MWHPKKIGIEDLIEITNVPMSVEHVFGANVFANKEYITNRTSIVKRSALSAHKNRMLSGKAMETAQKVSDGMPRTFDKIRSASDTPLLLVGACMEKAIKVGYRKGLAHLCSVPFRVQVVTGGLLRYIVGITKADKFLASPRDRERKAAREPIALYRGARWSPA
jgi:hypothetical protein